MQQKTYNLSSSLSKIFTPRFLQAAVPIGKSWLLNTCHLFSLPPVTTHLHQWILFAVVQQCGWVSAYPHLSPLRGGTTTHQALARFIIQTIIRRLIYIVSYNSAKNEAGMLLRELGTSKHYFLYFISF